MDLDLESSPSFEKKNPKPTGVFDFGALLHLLAALVMGLLVVLWGQPHKISDPSLLFLSFTSSPALPESNINFLKMNTRFIPLDQA